MEEWSDVYLDQSKKKSRKVWDFQATTFSLVSWDTVPLNSCCSEQIAKSQSNLHLYWQVCRSFLTFLSSKTSNEFTLKNKSNMLWIFYPGLLHLCRFNITIQSGLYCVLSSFPSMCMVTCRSSGILCHHRGPFFYWITMDCSP